MLRVAATPLLLSMSTMRGSTLADQLALLARLGVQGAGLYRYGSLFANSGAQALAESEAEAIKGVWQG